MSLSLDHARQELAILRKIASYESLAKRGRLSQEAADSLISFERECLGKLKALQAAQGELPLSGAKRKV